MANIMRARGLRHEVVGHEVVGHELLGCIVEMRVGVAAGYINPVSR